MPATSATVAAATGLISPTGLRELAAAHAVREAALVHDADAGGWVMVVRTGLTERVLRMRDAARPRLFATTQSAVAMAHRLGLPRLVVDVASAPVLPELRRRYGARA